MWGRTWRYWKDEVYYSVCNCYKKIWSSENGLVDENGEFTGESVAYIYQDLKLALIGYFKKGIMVRLPKPKQFF